MKKICYLFLCTFFLLILANQNLDAQNLLWAKSFGSIDMDQVNDMVVDDNGNVYLTGYFQGTVDFDPGQGTDIHTSNGHYDGFVQKLDSDGNLLWVKTFGGNNYDEGLGIALDQGGSNVYITGYFRGTVDFDTGPGVNNHTSEGESDIFIMCLTNAGNFLWAKSIGGTGNDAGTDIAISPSGYVQVTGYFYGNVDFNPAIAVDFHQATGTINSDVFVLKMDANGDYLWTRTFGGTDYDAGLSLVIDASGNIYTTGYFLGTVDFDTDVTVDNHSSNGLKDVFVQKLDFNGNFIWAKTFGGNGNDIGKSIDIDNNGNIILTGSFAGTVDFNPGNFVDNHISNGSLDIFVEKLDATGDFVWARTFGGSSEDVGNSVTHDYNDNIFLTGYFFDTVDFDPDIAGFEQHTSNGNRDIFIEKFASNSAFQWAETFGGNNINDSDTGVSIAINNSGIYTAGTFQGTIDLAPGSNSQSTNISNGAEDWFISKICDPPMVTANATSTTICQGEQVTLSGSGTATNYIWDNGVTDGVAFAPTATTTYTVTGTNANGCTNTDQITITVIQVNTSVTNNDPTLIANATNATFQWVDCNNNFAPIAGETSASFTATTNGSYAVMVTQNGCTQTSTCYTISSLGIKDISDKNKIRVYPNPATDKFTIDLSKSYTNVSVQITNAIGQAVYIKEKLKTAAKIPVRINGISSGIYFVQVYSENKLIAVLKINKH